MYTMNVRLSFGGKLQPKEEAKEKIQVWHTGFSDPWNLGTPLMRRHPLVTPTGRN